MGHTSMTKNIIAFASMAAVACFGAVSRPAAITVEAQRTLVAISSRRIVSVGGAVTEILYALGLEQRIIAVDSTSLYPPRALADKPSVGYMRQLSAEGVLGLAPSLVLAAEGSGPKETIAVLEAARVPFVRVPDRFTGEGVVEKIRVIAKATGVVARGECLARAVEADLAALTALRQRIEQPIKVLFILSFMDGRPVVAGRNTAADGIITLAGAAHAITDYEGYKLVNDEAVIAARPDAILVMERKSLRIDAQTVFEHPALRATPAAARKGLRPPWKASISWALGRAPHAPRATWRRRSIPRSAMTSFRRDGATLRRRTNRRSAAAVRQDPCLARRRAVSSFAIHAEAGSADLADPGAARGRYRCDDWRGRHPPAPHRAGRGSHRRPQTDVARDWLVLWSIRLPRIALAVIIGSLLAVCGAVMQGLFRNPLADPALVGVSSGAALTTAAMIVIRDRHFVSSGASCRSKPCRSPLSSAR